MKQQSFICNGERFALLVKTGEHSGKTLYSGNGSHVWFEKPVNAIKSAMGLEIHAMHLHKMRSIGIADHDAAALADKEIESIQKRMNAVSVAVEIADDEAGENQ
jgi:hypothetical protein